MVSRLMIDTNVILDVIGEREPFFKDSREVLRQCELGKIRGCISSSSITDIFYLVHKELHNKEQTYNVIGQLLSILKVLPVTEKNVKIAYEKHAIDFEDCLVAECAKANHCKAIITRNPDDFKDLDIRVFMPKQFLEQG